VLLEELVGAEAQPPSRLAAERDKTIAATRFEREERIERCTFTTP
jgi:hypothetical protein